VQARRLQRLGRPLFRPSALRKTASSSVSVFLSTVSGPEVIVCGRLPQARGDAGRSAAADGAARGRRDRDRDQHVSQTADHAAAAAPQPGCTAPGPRTTRYSAHVAARRSTHSTAILIGSIALRLEKPADHRGLPGVMSSLVLSTTSFTRLRPGADSVPTSARALIRPLARHCADAFEPPGRRQPCLRTRGGLRLRIDVILRPRALQRP
jgi:hypothetical protein